MWIAVACMVVLLPASASASGARATGPVGIEVKVAGGEDEVSPERQWQVLLLITFRADPPCYSGTSPGFARLMVARTKSAVESQFVASYSDLVKPGTFLWQSAYPRSYSVYGGEGLLPAGQGAFFGAQAGCQNQATKNIDPGELAQTPVGTLCHNLSQGTGYTKFGSRMRSSLETVYARLRKQKACYALTQGIVAGKAETARLVVTFLGADAFVADPVKLKQALAGLPFCPMKRYGVLQLRVLNVRCA